MLIELSDTNLEKRQNWQYALYPKLEEDSIQLLHPIKFQHSQSHPISQNPKKSSVPDIPIPEDSGILVQPGFEDTDALRISRIINLIEPILIYTTILATIWITMLDESNPYMYIIFGLLLLWILLISPPIHYYLLNEKQIFLPPSKQTFFFWFFKCKGLGDPVEFYSRIEGELGFVKYWKMLAWLTVFLDVLFMGALVEFYVEYAQVLDDLFGFHSDWLMVAVFFGVLPFVDLVLFFGVYPVFIRLDNFGEGVRTQLGKLTLLGCALIPVFNIGFQLAWDWFDELPKDSHWRLEGKKPFLRIYEFTFVADMGQWCGYNLWGFVQQLLFLGSFSSMFCRAFDIQNNWYGTYVASLCSACFFAGLHIPSYWLAFATFVLGFFWSRAYIQVRSLSVLGISHGMLATLTCQLLPINFSVGPKLAKFWWFFGFNTL